MNKGSMAGWIGFAGIVMLIMSFIDFFQGLPALFKDDYFVVTTSPAFSPINLSGWGWVMIIWGVLLVDAGSGFSEAQSWARWYSIVVVGRELLRRARVPRRIRNFPRSGR